MATLHAESSNNPLLPNGTFIAEVIAFLIILWIVWKYIVPPVQKAMSQRQQMIEDQVSDSEKAKQQLAEAEAAYQNALNEARTTAAQIRDGARAEGQHIIEEMRATAQTESARIIARGEEQLAGQREAILRELRGEIGGMAVELSERIVSERLADEQNVRATVDAFLADLERSDTPTRSGSAE